MINCSKKIHDTQADLAKSMGVSPRTVWSIISEGRLTKDKYLNMLAKALEVVPTFLLPENEQSVQIGGKGSIHNSGDQEIANAGKIKHIGQAASPVTGRSLADKLERLAKLRKQNLLTKEEFSLAKQRLLKGE